MTPPTPDMAHDLVRIHKVITRAIDVSLIKGMQLIKSDRANSQEILGYSRYTHSLSQVLDAHHKSEDVVIFPAMQKVIPSAPYARLTAEHHQVEKLLGVIRPAVDKLPSSADDGLNEIVDSLQKLTLIWSPHYQMEEKNFSSEAINAAVSPEDQKRLTEAATRLSQEHSGPPYWVVPFVLYNLERKDRDEMVATLPPEIMGELVPKVWKEQWEPMKPLLLE